jgi:hypothetical protein
MDVATDASSVRHPFKSLAYPLIRLNCSECAPVRRPSLGEPASWQSSLPLDLDTELQSRAAAE